MAPPNKPTRTGAPPSKVVGDPWTALVREIAALRCLDIVTVLDTGASARRPFVNWSALGPGPGAFRPRSPRRVRRVRGPR